jgi:hypothetical protein
LRRAVSILVNEDPQELEKHTREAVKVDGTKEGEEAHSMFRKFGEVLVNHFQCAFKHILHDNGNLVLHKSLELKVSKAF